MRLAGTCAFRCPVVMWRNSLPKRGLFVDHVTVWRWVQRYAPEIQRRLQTRLRPTNDSWRVPAGHNLVSNPTTGAEIKRILGGEIAGLGKSDRCRPANSEFHR